MNYSQFRAPEVHHLITFGHDGEVNLVEILCTRIEELTTAQRRVVVGIDGPDGSGKTTLADSVAKHLQSEVIRASVDGFHNRRSVRQRQGALSPQGYYQEAFDYESLVGRLLRPFKAGNSLVTARTWDWRSDSAVKSESVRVSEHAALVFDGVFLLRPELRAFWDFSIYLRVSPTDSIDRALIRDVGDLGSAADVRERYEQRYLPAQAIYRSLVNPERQANVVVDNADYHHPIVLERKGASAWEIG